MWIAIVVVSSVLLIGYTWAGYPSLLWVLRRFGAREICRRDEISTVTILIAAHNEERVIAGKLENCLAMDYAPDKFDVIVVSDGSTDKTEKIVEQFAARDGRVRLLRTGGRAGKSMAQNLGAQTARGELLFLTDAGTRVDLQALRLLASDLTDPAIGLVTGTLELATAGDAISKGQSRYWHYELFIRQLESDLDLLATGSGVAIAMKRLLFRPMQPMYGDDCILPLDVRLAGYRVLHNSQARAYDSMPHSIAGEMRARIRMTARNWTGTLSRKGLLNPFRYPGIAFALMSHKLLRWLTPVFLLMLLVSSCCGAVLGYRLYQALLVAQVLFYLSAYVGWTRFRKDRLTGMFGLPFSFCLANVGFLGGLWTVLRSQRIIAYDNR